MMKGSVIQFVFLSLQLVSCKFSKITQLFFEIGGQSDSFIVFVLGNLFSVSQDSGAHVLSGYVHFPLGFAIATHSKVVSSK